MSDDYVCTLQRIFYFYIVEINVDPLGASVADYTATGKVARRKPAFSQWGPSGTTGVGHVRDLASSLFLAFCSYESTKNQK